MAEHKYPRKFVNAKGISGRWGDADYVLVHEAGGPYQGFWQSGKPSYGLDRSNSEDKADESV